MFANSYLEFLFRRMSIKDKDLRGFAFAALGMIIWTDKRHKHFATVFFFQPNFELAQSWETKTVQKLI